MFDTINRVLLRQFPSASFAICSSDRRNSFISTLPMSFVSTFDFMSDRTIPLWLQESTAKVFVVATANDVTKLPPELLRKGRFDELFFLDLPSEAERRDIINLHTERNLLPRPSKEMIDNLVYLSNGFAGSDLEGAVRDVPIRSWGKERAVPASGLA